MRIKLFLILVVSAVGVLTMITGGMALVLFVALLPTLLVSAGKVWLATSPFWLIQAVVRRSLLPQRNNVAHGIQWWGFSCLLPFSVFVWKEFSFEQLSQSLDFGAFSRYGTAALLTLPIGIVAFFCRKHEYESLVRGRRQARFRP
jgi:hypothetical protein